MLLEVKEEEVYSLEYSSVNKKDKVYSSVLKECPQEQVLVTLGLFILNPAPIKLSI